MTMSDLARWERRVLASEGSAERVAALETELRKNNFTDCPECGSRLCPLCRDRGRCLECGSLLGSWL
jgi:hypothetical protein